VTGVSAAAWAARIPEIRPARIRPLRQTLAMIAPTLPAADLALLSALNLWIFAIDDLFDEGGLTVREVDRRCAGFRAVLRDPGTPTSPGSLDRALADVTGALGERQLHESLGRYWRAAMCATLDGMRREHRWRIRHLASRRRWVPAADEYRRCGRASVGAAPHVWGLLMLLDDPSVGRELPGFRRLIRAAALCVRLANDLRSHDREVAEGGVNAVLIAERALLPAGARPDEARRCAVRQVQAELRRHLHRIAWTATTVRTDTGAPEAAILATAQVSAAFYARTDFHLPPSGAGAPIDDREVAAREPVVSPLLVQDHA
jgi:hypothetical protein